MMHVGQPVSTPNPVGWNQVGNSQQPPPGTIPLNTLIDYIIQKTYHDVVVLAELLPGKSDLERKIDIAHFANRTRQYVIRLLTIVKWAGSVSKVMKCDDITRILDQQASLFIDTADKLHTLANQFVVQARLPNFSIPAAIDVLVTGTYPRLPKVIRDRIIPPDPVTPLEKAITLKRLNEIISHRLAVTKIPLQIADVKVEKGMVTLTVPGEFKAILTLMGQSDDIPWRLLKISIAIEDKDVSGGNALVHSKQVDYVHELAQSRLLSNKEPLEDLYRVLHSFCISLKVEVLQAQAHRLLRQRWGRLIQIDEYQPGNKVVLSYWRPSIKKLGKQEPMSITIQQRLKNETIVLQVAHRPELAVGNLKLVENSSTIDHMSLERLLVDTILVRSHNKLHDLWQILRKHVRKDTSYISDSNSCLIIPLAKPFHSSGNLYVSVDPQVGTYVCASTDTSQQIVDEIEKSINDSIMNLIPWMMKLQMIMAKEHCISTVQNLPAVCVDNLSLSNKSSQSIKELGENVIFIKLTYFDRYYIVVQIVNSEVSNQVISFKYHLLRVAPTLSTRHQEEESVDLLVEINATYLQELNDKSATKNFYNSELAFVIATCNARIPFTNLMHELNREKLSYQDLMVDGDTGFCLKLLDMSDLSVGEKSGLIANTVQCSFRLIDKIAKSSDFSSSRIWNVELVFVNNPLKPKVKQSNPTRAMLKLDQNSDSTAKAFKEYWSAVAQLYDIVCQFAEVLYEEKSRLAEIVTVYSYDYQSLVLKYGPRKNFSVTIKRSPQAAGFALLFGRTGSSGYNGHSYSSHHLNNFFNRDPDIGKLVQVLHDTIIPIHAACSISTVPVIGFAMGQQNSKQLSNNFSILMQCPWRFLMIYRSTCAIEVCCMPGNRVAITDGSLSKFESSKFKENVMPIDSLINFIRMICKSSKFSGVLSTREDSTAEKQVGFSGNWTSSTPVIISHSDFVALVREPQNNRQGLISIIEQFLSLSVLKRDLMRHTHNQEVFYNTQNVPNKIHPTAVSSTYQFSVNSLLFSCSLQFTSERLLTLALNVQQVSQFTLQERGLPLDNWHNEHFRILERFFKDRVASPPYRPNNLYAFCTIISAKPQLLSDFINLMRLELTNHQNDQNVQWIPQICLTIPPRMAQATPGAPAVYIKDKILVVLLMTSRNSTSPAGRQSVVMPIVMNPNGTFGVLSNKTNHPPIYSRIDAHLKQYTDTKPPNTRSQLSTVVKYLMDNFTAQ